jgi:diphthamide synthase (EF-2-diphthine--ammonia ligase)
MDVVALLSGGKDSCFNACHAVKQGHRLVALATLSPEQGKGKACPAVRFKSSTCAQTN